jgi:hypothetical protein
MPAVSNAGAVCRHRHQLIRFEVTHCPAGHEHRVFRCPMRYGAGWCGDRVVVPPYTATCRRTAS